MRSAPRRWTLILVPPNPGARTRSVSIGAQALRNITAVASFTVIVAAVWSILNARSVVVTSDRLATAEQMIFSLQDSVHTLRAQVLYDAAQVDSAPSMILPVSGQITSSFQRSRFHPLLQIFRPHHGIDLSAPAGTQIVAPAVATVSFVGWRMGDGLTVELTHNGGVTTLYGHCQSTLVKVGERVHAGQAIGTVGASGLATGPHVHFEVMMRGTPIDPLRYLNTSHDSATAVAERLRAEDR